MQNEILEVKPKVLKYFKEMIAEYDFDKETEYYEATDWIDDSVQTKEKKNEQSLWS